MIKTQITGHNLRRESEPRVRVIIFPASARESKQCRRQNCGRERGAGKREEGETRSSDKGNGERWGKNAGRCGIEVAEAGKGDKTGWR